MTCGKLFELRLTTEIKEQSIEKNIFSVYSQNVTRFARNFRLHCGSKTLLLNFDQKTKNYFPTKSRTTTAAQTPRSSRTQIGRVRGSFKPFIFVTNLSSFFSFIVNEIGNCSALQFVQGKHSQTFFSVLFRNPSKLKNF